MGNDKDIVKGYVRYLKLQRNMSISENYLAIWRWKRKAYLK